jgi:hypothetical protein
MRLALLHLAVFLSYLLSCGEQLYDLDGRQNGERQKRAEEGNIEEMVRLV